MKYKIKVTNRFTKDLKQAVKRGYDLRVLGEAVEKLSKGEKLPPKNREHSLSGDYS